MDREGQDFDGKLIKTDQIGVPHSVKSAQFETIRQIHLNSAVKFKFGLANYGKTVKDVLEVMVKDNNSKIEVIPDNNSKTPIWR